jgi:hypothetical protein
LTSCHTPCGASGDRNAAAPSELRVLWEGSPRRFGRCVYLLIRMYLLSQLHYWRVERSLPQLRWRASTPAATISGEASALPGIDRANCEARRMRSARWLTTRCRGPLRDIDFVRGAVEEMRAKGQKFVHESRLEPWGQTVARFMSPEGLLIGLSYAPWLHEK